MKKFILILLCLTTIFICSSCNFRQTDEESVDDTESIEETMQKDITLIIGDYNFKLELIDSETTAQFLQLLPLEIDISELNGNEYYSYLNTNLVTNQEKVGTITEGDVMLYGSNCFVIFYKSFSTSYSYTPLGKVNDTTNLENALRSTQIIRIEN